MNNFEKALDNKGKVPSPNVGFKTYKKIDVYHNGKYAHSTMAHKTLKDAKTNSRLEGGKITAEYNKK
jgi:hypothetical protein